MSGVPTCKTMKILVLLFVGAFSHAQPMMKVKPVSPGEELQFRLSYGWFTIGRGTFKVAEEVVVKDGRECLKIDVEGRTAGLAGVFSRVEDRWGALIDKETFQPYYSYRDLSEGDYDLDEKVYFNYDSMKITFEQVSRNDKNPRPVRYFDLPDTQTFDMMGGLMFARSIDYRKLNAGDTIHLKAFFDKKFYDFKMIYHGIEMIDSKVGEIYCHKVKPIMEENSVFVGQDAITFWVSADANRLPLRVSANMKFGTAYCELTGYKNIKSGIDFK